MTLNNCQGRISITLRGFEDPTESLLHALKGVAKHHGRKGGAYRGRIGTKNSESYIFNEIVYFDDDDIDEKIAEILSVWGGRNNIINAIVDFSIRYIHMEILTNSSRERPLFLSKETIETLYKLSAKLTIAKINLM